MSEASADTVAYFGVQLHEGRLLKDTEHGEYAAVEDVDAERLTVTVRYFVASDEGRETPHGRLAPTDDVETVQWPSGGGRFIPV